MGGGPTATSATDAAVAADNLAAAQAAQRAAQRRLEHAEAARGRRRNPQGIELAGQDLAAAELRLARARAGFDEAVHAQAAQAGDPDGRRDATERLATVDAALGLQAERAVETRAPYLAAVLGERPASVADRTDWDAGARSVERYRHIHLGLSPADGAVSPEAADPLVAAVGIGSDGGAYDDVVGAVHYARTRLLLADLAREAPDIAYESTPAAGLADRPLPSLVDELERTKAADSRRAVAERRAEAARRDVARAEAAMASIPAPSPSRRFGRGDAPTPDAAGVSEAQRRLDAARAMAEVSEAALDATPVPEPGHLATLEDAIILRERHVGADALREPPAWLRADVTRRVALHPAGHGEVDPGRLATAYSGVATYAERAGITGADRLDDILAAVPPTEELARYRHTVMEDLDLGQGAGVDAGVDLGL